MMSNVVDIIGGLPPEDDEIRDMAPGETGYTVPWAYNRKTETLDTDYLVYPQMGGTATLLVECVEPGKYRIEFRGG